MGETVTGNKSDLIARALSALQNAKELTVKDPNNPRFSIFLQYIAMENGGTLHAGYKRTSPLKATKVLPSQSPIIPLAAKTPRNDATGAKTTLAASRPFENVTYTLSPFNVFSNRLYTKVIDGRQGFMLINDFVLNATTCEALSDHRIKVYMGNPMNTMPFGMAKVIDVFFSDACWITVNGRQIPENSIIPNKKKIWACVPPDITDLLFLKPGITNKIEIRFSAMIPKCMVTIELVKVLTPEQRVEIICEQHRHPKSKVLDEKKKSFLADEDIIATSEAISLRDPILQLKIKKPGRSIACKHTQCFDLETFFKMNEKSNTFICPICNSRLKWENIIFDEYFAEILDATSNLDYIDTIEIQPDGSWSLPTNIDRIDETAIKKENQTFQDAEITVLSDEDEQVATTGEIRTRDNVSENQAGCAGQQSLASLTAPAQNLSTITPSESSTRLMNSRRSTTIEVIDLTLSSDEDEPLSEALERIQTALLDLPNQNGANTNQENTIQAPQHNEFIAREISAHDCPQDALSQLQPIEMERNIPGSQSIDRAIEDALVQLENRNTPVQENISMQMIDILEPQTVNEDFQSAGLSGEQSFPIIPITEQQTESIFESGEIDGILSSLPESVFSHEVNQSRRTEKPRRENNMRTLNSSRLEVPIPPSSPTESASNDLEQFLASIPDDILDSRNTENADFQVANIMPTIIQSAPQTSKSNETDHGVNNDTVLSVNHSKGPEVIHNTQFSLKVAVSDINDESSRIDDINQSSNLMSEDCVLTPSAGTSDDECDYTSSSKGILGILIDLAKENMDQSSLLSMNQQRTISFQNDHIRIEKTWTAQDEDALRQVAESIFADTDEQKHKNNLKRPLPDD